MTLNAASGKCSTCALGQFCLPVGLSAEDVTRLDALAREKVRVRKGETLYQQDERLGAVYAVRLGTFKTQSALHDGRVQVTSFILPGEILGLDGIGEMKFPATAIALEDSEVCLIRFAELEALARQLPSLQAQFHRIMSREMINDRRHFLALGSMRAEERLADFLLDLSSRLALRGYSASEFHLRMSREDIGSFLGMQIETVSRLFSRFVDSGLLQVKARHVKIIDQDALRELAGREPEALAPAQHCPHHG